MERQDLLKAALADRYLIQEEIGQGGMATVYRALDLKHERDVAIKVLRPELAASMGKDRFLREIRVTAKLNHPHIIPLHDSGEAGGFFFFVMPLIEGESLRDRLTRESQLPVEDALRIAGEVAGALEYAHGVGIIHRDIKPENILLSGGHALVADFGVAGALSIAGGDRLTSTGTTVGTPAYMSPEQATGEDPDVRSDLYSLSCVLFEMLTGQPPFTGATPQAVLARHTVDDVPSIRAVRTAITPELESLVFRGLAKSPADRFRTPAELAEALTGVDATPWHTGSGPRTASQSDPLHRRRRSLAWGGAAVIALLLGGWWWVAVRSGGDGPPGLEAGGLDPHRIAILYLEDLSPDGELEPIARGLTEGLIDRLTLTPALHVISSNGVARFREAEAPPETVAAELAAGTVVRGTIERLGDELRTSVRLLDGESGVQFAGQAFTVPGGDMLAVRDSLLVLVETMVRERLGEEIRVRQERLGATNSEAWLLLQRGERTREPMDSLLQIGAMEELEAAYQRADSLFAVAESLDPRWSEPATHRAWLEYEHARWIGTSDQLFTDRWTTVGLEHAERALALDSLNADALEARGILKYWRFLLGLETERQAARALFSSAEDDLRAAIALNRRQASAWATLSHLLINKSGDRSSLAEARLTAERALEADAYLENASTILNRLFSISYDLEDRVRAEHWCREGARRYPESPSFVDCQIMLMTFDGAEVDVGRAWELADQAVELTPASGRELHRLTSGMLVAAALANAGLADSALSVIERSRGNPSLDPTRDLLMLGAIAHTRMQSWDGAVELLTEFVSANPLAATDLTTSDYWWWRGLQDHRGFQELGQLGGELR